MATTLTVRTSGRGVVAPIDFTALATAVDSTGNNWLNDGFSYLFVQNTAGTSLTVTLVFATTTLVDGQVPPNETVVITTLHYVIIGPFPISLFNDNTGKMNVTYSATPAGNVLAFHTGV